MGAPDGASDEARTRYLHLGKVALYQMSYTRNNSDYYNRESKNVKYKMKKIFGEAFPISGGRWHGVAMTDEGGFRGCVWRIISARRKFRQ